MTNQKYDTTSKVKGKKPDCEAEVSESFSPKSIIKERRQRLRDKSDLKFFFFKVILFFAMIWVMLVGVFGIKPMDSMDMHPRISPRDLVIYYRWNPTNQTSRVMIYEKNGEFHLGRIVARPGDNVEIKSSGGLYVNGAVVGEADIYYETKPYQNEVKYPLKLAENQYFLLGDYREGAKDSRYFGPVEASELKGEVIAIIRKSGL